MSKEKKIHAPPTKSLRGANITPRGSTVLAKPEQWTPSKKQGSKLKGERPQQQFKKGK